MTDTARTPHVVPLSRLLPVAIALVIGGLVLPQPARFLIGSAAMFFVPGLPLAYLIHGAANIGAADLVPLGFAYTLAVIAPLTMAGMLLHGPPMVMLAILGAITAAAWLAALSRSRRQAFEPVRSPERPALWWNLTIAAAGLAIGYAVYHEGGSVTFLNGDPRGEEAMHLGMIRHLAEAPWSVDGIFYKPATIYTSIFVPYHALLALISRFTATDSLLTYIYLRPLLAVVTMGSFAGAIRYLTGSVTVTRIMLTISLALMAAGWATEPGGIDYFWGLFAPVTHASDFGLGTIVPLCVFLIVRLLTVETNSLRGVLGTLFIMLAVIVIRPRDSSHIASYLFASLPLAFLFKASPFYPVRYRLLALTVPMAGIGYAWSRYVRHTLEHIVAYEDSAKMLMWRSLQAMGHWDSNPAGSTWELVKSWRPIMFDGLITNMNLLGNPYIYLGLVLIPVWMVLARRSKLLWLVLPPMMVWLVIIRFQMLIYFINLLTLSVAAVNPVRFIFQFAILLVTFAVAMVIYATGRIVAVPFARSAVAQGAAHAIVSLAIGGVLGRILIPALQRSFYAKPWPYFSWILVGGIVALILRLVIRPMARAADRFVEGFQGTMTSSWGTFAATVAFAAALVASPYAQTPFARASHRPRPQAWTLEGWYATSVVKKVVPWEILHAVREEFPKKSVIAADFTYQPIFAALTANHIPTIGTKLSTEIDYYTTAYRLMGKEEAWFNDPVVTFAEIERPFYYLVGEQSMVYNAKAAPDWAWRYLHGFHVDGIVIEPANPKHVLMVEMVKSDPHIFTPVISAHNYELYRINHAALGERVAQLGPPTPPPK